MKVIITAVLIPYRQPVSACKSPYRQRDRVLLPGVRTRIDGAGLACSSSPNPTISGVL